jgi:NitT/TauT family transport system substrate-binding protein
VALNGASRFQKSNSIVSLVARTGEKIHKPEDFKGKKVGVPGLNSMLHVMFQKWLLDNKVPLNQVTMIEAPFPQMNDMLKGGTIDAAVAIEPFRARIVSGNTGYRVADYVTDIQDNVLAAFWMAKADWAKANPQVVKAYREAYDEGLDWCVKNPEEAKQLQVKYLGFPSPVIPSYSSAINAKDLEIFEQAGRQVGMLRQPVDVSKLVWK